MNSIEFTHVWKKFKKGEKMSALRDVIPQLVRNIFALKKKENGLKPEEFWAVQDVTFHVKKGEVLGIIGPNGAGKSTILKLLSGIMRPIKGEFKIHGRLSALIEVTAGFHPDFTGRENIYFNGAVIGMTKKEIDRKYEQIVEFSGVREFIDTPVKRYSSGMMARLGFAVAAHVEPDVLLVDEVLSVGDMTFQNKCTQKMRELLNSGVTIIFISHNISLVQSLCQRVILLDKGKILLEGAPGKVIPAYDDLVNASLEKEIEKQLTRSDHKLLVRDETLTKILRVSLYDQNKVAKDIFQSDEPITIEFDYETKGTIEKPVFSCEIVRADGILCCHLDTRYAVAPAEEVNKKGTVRLVLDETHLNPGVYFTKIAIWDKDMIHPYVIIQMGIFKIGSARSITHTESIFFLKGKWSHDNKT